VVADPRTRLTQLGSSGRIDLWRVAARAFREEPLRGSGAGTFQTTWDRLRTSGAEATEAHSLYLGTLAELGVVGLVLVLAVLLGLGLAFARTPAARRTGAGGVAIVAAWAVHAAVDWDWEMPAVTVVLFVLAGAARPAHAAIRSRRAGATAVVATAGVVACTCGLWALSQARTDAAFAAYASGDCVQADGDAHAALELAPFRADARFVRAACLARWRRNAAATAEARTAMKADPSDYRGAYDAAVTTMVTGGDPRPLIARALRLDPYASPTRWLRYWLAPRRARPSWMVGSVAPLMLGNEPYPPILEPYRTRG
jgi:hypothetical protein